ncbi:MAG: hypothetical protein LBD23_13710, partial [Oscillospiraceae bacterium]|nr:hypothetical protein [Oscillospiraceae bacterium]
KNILNKDELTPLLSDNPRKKHILLETLKGFTDKGFIDMCVYCHGYPNINTKKVAPAGEQMRD